MQRDHVEIDSGTLQASLRIAQDQAERDQSILPKIESEIAIVEGSSPLEKVRSEGQLQMLQSWQSVPEHEGKNQHSSSKKKYLSRMIPSNFYQHRDIDFRC